MNIGTLMSDKDRNKSGKSHGKGDIIKDIENDIISSGHVLNKEKSIKNKRVYQLDPEKKYVRRTAEEFAAGAEPVRGYGSHRLSQFSLKTTPELHEAAKAAADQAGVTFVEWARAAFRLALRTEMDPHLELGSNFTVVISDDPAPDE
jgi:predicted HicB family RNase H-like nuclease